MTTTTTPKGHAQANLKELNAVHKGQLIIRDREHFYKIVKWLNDNVGKGEDKWTMGGRVLKSLKAGNTVNTFVYIFVADEHPSPLVYLACL